MFFSLGSLSKAVLSIFLLLSFYSSILTIYNGSENDSILRVYSDDEHGQVIRLQRMLALNSIDAGGFKEGFYHYGQAYSSLAYGLINILDHFGFNKYSYQASVLVLKILSITGYVLSIILMYLVLRSIGTSEFISSLFSLFFAAHSDYWGWATTIHPDTLQMCLFLLSLLLFVKIKNINIAVLVSSFVIGISFGTKYSGIFLTIFIASVVILHTFGRKNDKLEYSNLNYFVNISSWSIICFFFGWILLNPYVLYRFNRLLIDLSYQSKSISVIGGGRILNNNWFEWFSMFISQYGVVISSIISLGILFLLINLLLDFIKQKKANNLSNFVFDRKNITLISLFTSLVVNSIFLFVVIRYREWRYAFHILPFVFVLSGYGTHLLLKKYSNNILNIVLFICAFILLMPKAIANFELLATTHENEIENPYVAAGRWLQKNYDQDTRILSGVYSYVNSDYFKTVEYTFEVTDETIRLFEPDVIFMNDSVPGRYVWKRPGTKFVDNELVYGKGWKDQELVNEFGELFIRLTSSDSNWNVAYESDNVVIFEQIKEDSYE